MKKLGFGCMRFPMQGETIDVEEVEKMVDTFMERGFTYFDTSYVYHNGESESILKKVLVERYPRESFTITTKSPVFLVENQEQFFSIFQQQLDRLGTDYVDYYWLHAVNGEIYQKIQSLNLMDALIQLKKDGRTRHIGLSFHDSPELLDRILSEHPELEYVQLQLNYFDWDSPYVAAGRCYEVCKKHGKQVVVMEPVKGGALVNQPQDLEQKLRNCNPEASMASWAIRFCAGLDHVFMVLSGMSNMAQMLDNLSYMQEFKSFNEQEKAAVKEVANAMRKDMAYDPQSFAEAEKVCPKHIGIVKIAEMLNDRKKMNNYTNTCIYYGPYLGKLGKAADCDRCGKCMSVSAGQDVIGMLEEAEKTITHF